MANFNFEISKFELSKAKKREIFFSKILIPKIPFQS